MTTDLSRTTARWRRIGRWSDWRLSWRRRAGFAAAGAAVALGQAPLDLWFLALPVLALLIHRLLAVDTGRRAAVAGLFAGAGYFGLALFWIVEPFFVDAAHDAWMAPFALPGMAFGMALFWAVPVGLAAGSRGGPWRRALLMGLALAAGDLARSYLFTGFPWALFGHLWIGTPLAQLAAWGGPIGLSLLTCFACALAAAQPRRGALLALVLLAAGWGIGAWRLAQPLPPRPDAPVIRIAQPNATQKLKWQPEMQRLFFQRLLEETARPTAEGGRPALVVWPETAVPWLLDDPGPLLPIIADAGQGTPVALGIQRSEGARFYNSLAVVAPDATVSALYDKHHLVPFGEYIPFGDLAAKLGITAFAAQAGNGYSAGPGPALLNLGALGTALPLICYEAVFPQDLTSAPGRADWILQITNDAWFGNLSGPYQHLAQARLRAIEQGLPLIRAANTGVSAVIDAHGRVLARLPLNTDGALDAPLPAALPATLYSRTGDLPVALLLSALLACCATRLCKRRD